MANSRCRSFCYLRCQTEAFECLHSSSVQTVVLENSGAMATLLQQVQAAATLLAHYAGQPEEQRKRIAAAEVAKLKQKIHASPESRDSRLEIVEAIVGSDFDQADKDVLMGAVADCSADAGAAAPVDFNTSKKKGQDWEDAVQHVLPKSC